MLILVPMDSANVEEAKISKVFEAKVWVQLRVEDGALVEVLHHEKFDAFANWSEAVVVCDDSEPVMDFVNMSMIILVAHTQKSVEEIVEAYLFRELHDLAF